ncbi:sigma-70 family RNA polymerase sigma factor [Polyangium sp. y55x31]|uniref:RNA polymerase sigma factor n=1 Tax=Polyangium sp. y55x31 TaxID=3042688 RepID=UPI002482B66D|nr:sigma-70 family RNA polymerase sigma factor [Polyangium sp. y55x31]MDI1476230.1 sigma-70 family RNA polymerase sigma factor [Polyangium sp. y55x31]
MMKRQTTHRITVELLEAAARGERVAAGTLADFIYGRVQSVLHAGPDVEDATQEAFVAVIVALRTRRYDASVEDKHAWVVKIAVRKAIDVRRRRERERQVFDGPTSDEATDPASADPISRIEQKQQAARVNGVVKDLNETDRALLLLRYHEDLSYEDIAQALSIPLGTVKSRLSRLIEKLKLELGLAFPALAPRHEQGEGDLSGSEV